MIVPSDAGLKMSVFYQQPHMSHPEYGTIVSLEASPTFVHVLFLGDTIAKACLPQDLFWPPDFCARDGVNVPGQKFGHYKGL